MFTRCLIGGWTVGPFSTAAFRFITFISPSEIIVTRFAEAARGRTACDMALPIAPIELMIKSPSSRITERPALHFQFHTLLASFQILLQLRINLFVRGSCKLESGGLLAGVAVADPSGNFDLLGIAVEITKLVGELAAVF